MKILKSLLLATFLLSILLSPVTAAAPTAQLTWEVSFGTPHYSYFETKWVASSTPAANYVASVVTNYGGLSFNTFTFTPEPIERWMAGPNFIYGATGFRMSQTTVSDSFAQVDWSAHYCTPGPKVTFLVGKKSEIIFENTTEKELYLKDKRGNWETIVPGQIYIINPPKGAQQYKFETVKADPTWDTCLQILFDQSKFKTSK